MISSSGCTTVRTSEVRVGHDVDDVGRLVDALGVVGTELRQLRRLRARQLDREAVRVRHVPVEHVQLVTEQPGKVLTLII